MRRRRWRRAVVASCLLLLGESFFKAADGSARFAQPQRQAGPRRALVSGASGYLGRELTLQLLEGGWQVTACSRDTRSTRAKELELLGQRLSEASGAGDSNRLQQVEYDLASPPSAKSVVDHARPEVVFHCAAVFRPCEEPVAEMVTPNLAGVDGMVRACAAQGSPRPRLVLTSSTAAVRGPVQAPRPGRRSFDHLDFNDEAVKLMEEGGWHAAYQYSKAESERQAWELCRELGDLPLTVLCPSALIGPERRLPDSAPKAFPWMTASLSGTPLVGSMLAVDVRDAARAHCAAVEAGNSTIGQRFVVSLESEVEVANLASAFETLSAKRGKEAELQALLANQPAPTVECAARLQQFLKLECRELWRTVADMAEEHQADSVSFFGMPEALGDFFKR